MRVRVDSNGRFAFRLAPTTGRALWRLLADKPARPGDETVLDDLQQGLLAAIEEATRRDEHESTRG